MGGSGEGWNNSKKINISGTNCKYPKNLTESKGPVRVGFIKSHTVLLPALAGIKSTNSGKLMFINNMMELM